jgi:alpha-amylase
VGAGTHRRLQADPYVFARVLETDGFTDRVVVALGEAEEARTIPVGDVFADGTDLVDAYSGAAGIVRNGEISLVSPYGIVLLEPVLPAGR